MKYKRWNWLLQSPQSQQLSDPKFHTPLQVVMVVTVQGLALAWVMATSSIQHAPVELSAPPEGCRSVPAKSRPQRPSCDFGSWHWQLQWNYYRLSHHTLWWEITLMKSGKHVDTVNDTVDRAKHGCFLKPGSQQGLDFAWQINTGVIGSSTRMWELFQNKALDAPTKKKKNNIPWIWLVEPGQKTKQV